MRASESALEELHNEIATTLKEELARYRSGAYDKKERSESGDEVVTKVPVPAALIASTIKYLKDNGIDRPDGDEPDPSDLLNDELPKFGDI